MRPSAVRDGVFARLFSRLFSIDGRSLAAFRIGIGALVLVDLWTRSSAIEQHYSDLGILPREAYARLLQVSDWQWSVHLWTGSMAGQYALFVGAAAAACALIAGYRTRAAAVVTWALLVSLQARNPMVLYGADQLLRLLLFWSMFLPLGSSIRCPPAACRRAIDRRPEVASNPATTRHLSMATAALLLQPCVMYFFAGLLKSNVSWQSGAALGHALSSDMYVTPFGRMLAGFPELVSMLGRGVPWVEIFAPMLLLMPWKTTAFRKVGLPLLVAFHVAMGSALHTGLFQPAALVALIPFLPAGFWDRLGIGHGEVTEASIEKSASLASPAALSSSFVRWRSTVVQAVVAFLFAYGLAWNVVGLNVHQYAAQQGLNWMREWWGKGRTGVPLSFRDYAVERRMGGFGWIGRVSALHQRWDMFENVGPEYRGWPVIAGTLTDGQKVSVLDGGPPGDQGSRLAPEAPLGFYPGTRWLVYFTYLRTSGTQQARELLPAVVTRDWERRNPGKKLESLRILFVHPSTAAAGSTPVKTEVWYDGPANGSAS